MPRRSPIQRKIDQIRGGRQPRVLDLFAGCGGISLGFTAAGFTIEAAIEIDEKAARTHATNFHPHLGDQDFEKHALPRDITAIEPQELIDDLGLGDASMAFDVVVGGPPCQAYARVGRAKLRDVADHPQAFKVDPRGNLYLRYLHYVRELQPAALLMENVPDVLNYGGHNVMNEVAEVLSDLGYEVRYSLINSAFHGVPQLRDRVFLIAYHKSMGRKVQFPDAKHFIELPSGYNGTRSVAYRHIEKSDNDFFVEADHGTDELPTAVTCEDALGDLPPITLHLEGKLKRGARRFDELIPYRKKSKLTDYAQSMREWRGFENSEGLKDHVIRYLPRDTDIFREMPNGAEYPKAHATAVRLWEEKVREIELRDGETMSEDARLALKGKMVPPYPVGTFPNRWWKLRADFPSRTLMAHIGKDTYSHIHYNSKQARVISVREAARLQSFPDGFVFCGTMNPAYRQIGNAVPPLMAKQLAAKIWDALTVAEGAELAGGVIAAD